MYKQIIIARKDLNMSAGKLAAQVSHASMAFLTTMIRQCIEDNKSRYPEAYEKCYVPLVFSNLSFHRDLYEQWINGEFTKCVLQANNKNQLLKAVDIAKELGMIQGEDYFLIRDNCHTELTPEENGRTLTCIGFKPMDSEVIDQIGKKYHMYIG